MHRVPLLAASIALAAAMFASGRARAAEGGGGLSFAPPSYTPTTLAGQPGRRVVLTGTIAGMLFEPGTCSPVSAVSGFPPPGTCVLLARSEPIPPGFFEPALPGQANVAPCSPCTVDGRAGSFALKLTYPAPDGPQIARFVIQDAAGDLQGLRGEGTLDAATSSYTLTYFFSP